MSRFDEQAELALARPPRQPGIPVELVRAKHSAGAAFTLACDASGLDDKEIYLALELARERLKNEVLMQALRGGAR